MPYSSADTIFALATPPGMSAVAIVRISGARALQAPALFGVNAGPARQATRAFLKDRDGAVLDDVMLVAFCAPASATGEDILEIQCHGSAAVIADITAILADAEGFRPAEAGEFTRRALDNGKMDITSAEGLADLIEAETSMQRRQATAQMTGQLSRPVGFWRDKIAVLLAHLEAMIDFADEELPDALRQEIQEETAELCAALEIALDDQHIGEIIRNGLSVVLAGPVNAGKSTLLNLLAGRDAAIVSDKEGTTRDVIEVRLTLSGIPVRLADTAGLRQTEDIIEAEGIKRAESEIGDADLVLLVIDGSQTDWAVTARKMRAQIKTPCLLVVSKADKGQADAGDFDSSECLFADLTQPQTALLIEKALHSYLAPLNHASQTPIITRARHRDAFTAALASLRHSQSLSLQGDIALIAEEYRRAASALGRVTGHIDVEDLLDHIFSRFCIGK
ncbi:MAG: tRNA uridine-5-carboxymethylaminomethyl(34) synthesis GTPase MnmE [Candidatus Puniceispirillaceae bacterium]